MLGEACDKTRMVLEIYIAFAKGAKDNPATRSSLPTRPPADDAPVKPLLEDAVEKKQPAAPTAPPTVALVKRAAPPPFESRIVSSLLMNPQQKSDFYHSK